MQYNNDKNNYNINVKHGENDPINIYFSDDYTFSQLLMKFTYKLKNK